MDNRIYYGEYSLKHWIDLMLKQNIVLPEYQRYFVWNQKKVQTLIETFKNKQFVPPVTIGAYGTQENTANLILDGQQRLTSILLAYLGLFPDEAAYQTTIERYADDNDTLEEPDEPLDNIFEWRFDKLTEKGKAKSVILSNLAAGNYKIIDFKIDDDFFIKNFLGFAYLVPKIENQKDQQNYYSTVFRNINIQGQTLLPQESRASLYYLDKDLARFFTPDFVKPYRVKGLSSDARLDFVRYLALLSQYHSNGSANRVARGYKPKMEKLYEEYIYDAVADIDDKYGRFSNIFEDRDFDDRLDILRNALSNLEFQKEFTSIIDLDMYFFGLIYITVFLGRALDYSRKEEIKESIQESIENFKQEHAHTRAPSNLGHLRARITSSIEIYNKYAV